MELLVNGQQLELSTDFAIEIEETNPFFSEKGSQSLPVKLPFSQHNLSILDNPNRIARTNKLDTEHDAVLRHGVFQRNGRLIIFSASKEEGISCTFYIDEGDFYTRAGDLKLSEINFGAERIGQGSTQEEKAQWWVDQFTGWMRNGNSEFAVFPIITRLDTDNFSEHEYVNEVDLLQSTPYPLIGRNARTYLDTQVPAGYGTTCFIYLYSLLDFIFNHFGFSFKSPSIFHTDSDLSKIVVLNSVADTICDGKLDIADIVPDCTVIEFIDVIRNKFDCDFIFNSKDRSVRVLFFEDMAEADYDTDLSKFVVEKPMIEWESFKKLQISSQKTLDYAEPPTESIESIADTYNIIIGVDELMFNQIASYDDKAIVFRKANGMFYNVKKTGTGANVQYQLTPAGMFYFDHTRKNNLAEEKKQVSDEQSPIINYRKNNQPAGGLFAPLTGDRVHKKTGIKNVKTGDVKEERDTRGSIIFCYAIGMQRGAGMGTTTIYDANGERRSDSSLALCYGTNEGIVQRFWQAREKYLADALLPLKVKLNMPVTDILKIDMYKPKLINGMKALLSNFKYQITKNIIKITEANFLTLRRQLPNTEFNYGFNFVEPTETGYNYYWIKRNNADGVLNEILPFWGDHYYFTYVYFAVNEPTPESLPEPTLADWNAGGEFYRQSGFWGSAELWYSPGPYQDAYIQTVSFEYDVWFMVGRVAI
ncbi:MAG: hypothetical protein LBF04_03870 [Prevotellaceae bacterium]|jgi:hypothetical protein|nr:hypothetical protein [Prevotellaceae bacterium]